MWYECGTPLLVVGVQEGFRVAKKIGSAGKARMGRPPIPDRERKKPLVFRLNASELRALERKAQSLGLTKSEAIRAAIRRFTES